MPELAENQRFERGHLGPRRLEGREWWLWAYAVVVTLVLTVGIISLTFRDSGLGGDLLYSGIVAEWVRGLAAMVVLFDLYTVYQQLQIQKIRRRLEEREALFQIISENAADMIAVVDQQGRRIYNSPAYERLLGYSAEELAATSAIEQVHPDDRSRVLEAAEKANRTGHGERLEYRFRHRDGRWRILESTASPIAAGAGKIEGLVIVNRDITERKRSEALLEHQAFHDTLSGLPNRVLFLDRLNRAVAVASRHLDFRFAVLFIDLDDFRLVNESLGHKAGDDLLIQIARRLRSCLRGCDTVSHSDFPTAAIGIEGDNTLARPGGDEFLVLAEELHGPSDAVRMAERILQRLATTFEVENHPIVISASIGIVFGGGAKEQATNILRDAEIAMYRAKRAGKARYQVFDGAMHADALKRLRLETELRRGVDLGEFRVYYQPMVSLAHGNIVGFEALTRWQRADGLALPGEFIAVADEIGVTLPVNRQLLREASKQVRQWSSLDGLDSGLTISANITARQFSQPNLAAEVGDILDETGLNPRSLELEITENIVMANGDQSLRVLSQLKALGVRLSIDDFGTGYSSLSRLECFPVDTLKIDRTFVVEVDRRPETHEIVRIIVMLAHALGMQVVAEGIERQEQAFVLRQLGCEIGQGYLFAPPLDTASIESLLRTRPYFGPKSKAPLVPNRERKSCKKMLKNG
jgi:PAS domain S-box-containing protein